MLRQVQELFEFEVGGEFDVQRAQQIGIVFDRYHQFLGLNGIEELRMLLVNDRPIVPGLFVLLSGVVQAFFAFIQDFRVMHQFPREQRFLRLLGVAARPPVVEVHRAAITARHVNFLLQPLQLVGDFARLAQFFAEHSGGDIVIRRLDHGLQDRFVNHDFFGSPLLRGLVPELFFAFGKGGNFLLPDFLANSRCECVEPGLNGRVAHLQFFQTVELDRNAEVRGKLAVAKAGPALVADGPGEFRILTENPIVLFHGRRRVNVRHGPAAVEDQRGLGPDGLKLGRPFRHVEPQLSHEPVVRLAVRQRQPFVDFHPLFAELFVQVLVVFEHPPKLFALVGCANLVPNVPPQLIQHARFIAVVVGAENEEIDPLFHPSVTVAITVEFHR